MRTRETLMLEARISSPKGSLYIAAEATPYDVQQLRGHVRGLGTGDACDLCITLSIGPTTLPRVADLVAALAKSLVSEGIRVTLNDERVMPKQLC